MENMYPSKYKVIFSINLNISEQFYMLIRVSTLLKPHHLFNLSLPFISGDHMFVLYN